MGIFLNVEKILIKTNFSERVYVGFLRFRRLLNLKLHSQFPVILFQLKQRVKRSICKRNIRFLATLLLIFVGWCSSLLRLFMSHEKNI